MLITSWIINELMNYETNRGRQHFINSKEVINAFESRQKQHQMPMETARSLRQKTHCSHGWGGQMMMDVACLRMAEWRQNASLKMCLRSFVDNFSTRFLFLVFYCCVTFCFICLRSFQSCAWTFFSLNFVRGMNEWMNE